MALNGLDIVSMLSKKSEEELKNIVLQAWWDIETVEECMFDLGIDKNEFTDEEKRNILDKAIDEWGDSSQSDINDAIYNAVDSLHDEKLEEADND